jgi:protein gp37
MPLRWKEPKMIFVNSMSDLFHEKVPDEYIQRVFDVMVRADHHIFQVLTKRSERLMHWTRERYRFVNEAANGRPLLPRHIWLGVSVENQKHTTRVKDLQQVPARVRFLSIEPLLGSVELTASLLRGIHWVIVGGESGHKARPMDPQWATDVQRACRRNGVAFFFKQWGAHNAEGERVGKKAAGRVLRGRTWNEMPESIQQPESLRAKRSNLQPRTQVRKARLSTKSVSQ